MTNTVLEGVPGRYHSFSQIPRAGTTEKDEKKKKKTVGHCSYYFVTKHLVVS